MTISLSDAELEELTAKVAFQLYGDDPGHGVDERRHRMWAALPPATPEEIAERQQLEASRQAKRLAREGDPELLRQQIVAATGDPEHADFIFTPPRPKHARADYAQAAPFKALQKKQLRDGVGRVRDIIEQQTGKTRGISGLVIAVAAKILVSPALADQLQRSPEEIIREVIKRGGKKRRFAEGLYS